MTEPTAKFSPVDASQPDFKGEASDLDLSQILRNLSLSPDQRLLEHQNSLDLVWVLEAAGKRLREEFK